MSFKRISNYNIIIKISYVISFMNNFELKLHYYKFLIPVKKTLRYNIIIM